MDHYPTNPVTSSGRSDLLDTFPLLQAVAGGALQIAAAVTVLVQDSAFINNTAQVGGAVATYARSRFTCTSCNITANAAEGSGGAFAAMQGTVSLRSSTISDNIAVSRTDRVDFMGLKPAGVGGGLFLVNCSLKLDATDVVGNIASGSGGGMYLVDGSLAASAGALRKNQAGAMGGGAFIASPRCLVGSFKIRRTVISSNNAESGGGLAHIGRAECDLSEIPVLELHHGSFSSNTALAYGGAVYTSSVRLLLEGCQVAGNVAGRVGGGALAGYLHSASITNTTFTGNAADSGAGVAFVGLRGASSIVGSRFLGNYAFVTHLPVVGISQGVNATLTGDELRRPTKPSKADVSKGAKLQDATSSSLTAWPKCGDSGTGGGLCITPGQGPLLLSATEVRENAAMHGGELPLHPKIQCLLQLLLTVLFMTCKQD